MADIRIITGKRIVPHRGQSLRLAGYPDDGDDKGGALFDSLERTVRMLIQPKAAMAFSSHPVLGQVLYVVVTIGAAITKQIDRCFADKAYGEAMMLNAMADSCLFAMEEQVKPVLQSLCRERGVGISKRYEGGMNGDLTLQEDAACGVDAARTLGVTVTKEHVLLPIKSMSIVYTVRADDDSFAVDHCCDECTNSSCQWRHVERTIACRPHVPIMTQLEEQHLTVNSPCGGKGTCGKCRIRVTKGHLAVTPRDEALLTTEQLSQGWRLACQAISSENIEISVPIVENASYRVVGETAAPTHTVQGDHTYGIAVDIGTTTLAASLVERETGQVVATRTALNSQHRYGADVISRIQAANEGHLLQLQTAIRRDIQKLVTGLGVEEAVKSRLQTMTIGANTTMEHLLMGWDCQGLGAWPFSPISLGGETYPWEQIFSTSECHGTLTLLPGISTYVGADITAGIWKCAMMTRKAYSLLIDLGTNGEMALANEDRLIVASTAAGPALEGGNVTWGVGSVAGAICHAAIEQGQPVVETIDGASPIGICGTGMIDLLAALVQQGIVDTKGTLQEPYFSIGYPVATTKQRERIIITQGDIRGIQMAKGAIRAGVEILLHHAGLGYEDIAQVYLAGGFGYYLRPQSAAAIGLLPRELVAKTTAVGNTSLQGASAAIAVPTALDEMKAIAANAQEVVLSNDDSFQTLYMKYIDFDIEVNTYHDTT